MSSPNQHSEPRTYRDQLLTVGDLEQFRLQLIAELQQLLNNKSTSSNKIWLRSSEVRKMLGISAGTLQNLRVNRTLSYSKIGGIVFYKYDEIIRVLDHNVSK